MKKTFLSIFAAVYFSVALFAQVPPHRTCGTMDYHEYLKLTRPGYEADYIQYNQMLDQYMNSQQFASRVNGTAANITIPVVIHVVYNTAAQNISDAQAISQFSVLDNDFNHLNADTVNIPVPFRSVAGKSGIRFCLAVRDPNGNPTTGIVHKSTTVTSFVTDNKVKSSATGGDDPWDVTRYMNIWICPLGNNLLGYGEFPTGTISNTYGLVLNYTATGTIGTATAPFNKGRTGTHEFGHCFNLNHIWGDNGQCGASDNCTDTPPQKGGTAAPAGCNYGTPTFPWQPNTCTRPDGVAGANVTNTNGDMFMNFMDYTDDAAMNMFTKEQCLRMLAVVSTAPWNILQSSNACTPVSALDAGISSVIAPVNGSSTCNNNVTPKVTLNNAGSTTLTSATINYKMDALTTQTLAWSGSLASATSTVLTLNAYTGLSNAAHTFSVWVTSPNGGADQNAANNSMSSTFTVVSAPVGQVLPFSERFDATTFPPTGWTKLLANTTNTANTWSRLANTTGIPVVPTTTACAKMDNFSGSVDITGQLDALRTPALDLTGANSTLRLVFDRSHRWYGTSNVDSLNIYISTDCGGSWTRLYTKGGAQLATVTGTMTTAFTPTANSQWARDSVSLSAYVGQPSVYIKFESRSGWGNNLYLDNINVKFNPATAPPVASFSTVATKCAGSAITVSDQSTNSPTSWAWSFPGGTPSTSTSQNPSVTYTAGGTYTITLISANASGTSTPVSQTITVNATPTVAVSNATICSGSSANLIASGATTYSWNTGATTASISVTPTVATNYTVTGTTNGCVNTKTINVAVNATPTVAVSNATICSGSAANLTASGAATYSWNTGATTSSVAVSPTISTTYSVTGTTSGCANTKTVSVTVNTTPTVAVSSATICRGSSANLTATGATSYTWNTGATTASISVTPTITTNYTVTGANSGCVNTKTLSVTVNATPTVAASSGTVCSGSSVNLTATGATSYTWNTGATTASISVTPTITTNYSVTGTNALGCTNTKTLSVTVNALPSTAVSSSTICAGSTGTLVASGASTYSWNTGATGASIAVSPTVNTTYTVTGTSAAGCVKTATASVTVGSAPSIAVNSTSICSGSSATLSATGVTTYTWNTGANTSSISVSPAATTVYTVSGNLTGCTSIATKTVSVNVASNPTVAVSNATVCSGSSANLNATGASSYTWNTGATTSSISVTPTVTSNYTVTGANASGCVNSKAVSVTVNNLPNVTVNSATICSGSSANLVASGASTYTWNTGANGANLSVSPTSNTSYSVAGSSAAGCVNYAVSNVVVTSAPSISINSATICSGSTATLTASGVTTYTWSTLSNATSINVNPTATTVYSVAGTLSGCTTIATQTAVVTVNSLPVVTLGAISGPLCTTDAAVALSGSPANGIYSGVGVTGSSFDPALSGAGSFTVSYYYTDNNSCSSVATQTVDVSVCTGINEINDAAVTIYPNPTKDVIHVKMDASLVDNATINLYDAIGKLVISERVNNTTTTLNLKDFATGMYTIRVVAEGKQSIIKVIKQ
ncbi:MAG TPA: T9SS type A sorting domain-containing protein [Bacteroidia bacterium]|nr:T9SS type A sorting domain-containing protein [Bacteroidia bacterium]